MVPVHTSLKIAFCLYFSLSIFQFASATSVSVAAIDWCPQICLDKNKPGYIVEIVEEVFKNSPYQMAIDYYPWSRAIMLTKTGQVTALLSPAKAEAPTLLFPDEEVGIQRMCFFTLKSSSWQYTGPGSLTGLQIGLATDASVEELDSYVAKHPEQFQFQPYHERYIKQNAGKLDRERIDGFLFTNNSTVFEFNRLGIQDKYRNAGCVNTTKVYMAFTNNKENNKEINKIMSLFDQRIVSLHQQGTVKRIMSKYQLSHWR